MKKKVFLMLLALSIILPESLSALDFSFTYAGQTLNYSVPSRDPKTCYVSKSGDMVGKVIIPDTVTYNNTKYAVTNIAGNAFRDCDKMTSIIIPNSILQLGEYALAGCSGLTSIELPNSITILGQYAFYECSALSEIKLPSSLASIGEGSFANCTSLTSIDLPESLTILGYNAFSYCSSLKSGRIPNSIKIINPSTFAACTSLSTVEIPNSVTEIRAHAFSECTALSTITIPNSVTNIGDNTFWGCTNLSSVQLGNSVEHIGLWAFGDCPKLKSIKIPDSLISLSACVWGPEIEEVEYLTEKPCSSVYDVFPAEVYEKATLYILKGTKEIFMSTEPWMYFKNIKEKDASSIDSIIADNESDTIDLSLEYSIYSLDGIERGNSIENLTPGVYIIRQGMKTKKYLKL